MHMQPLFERGLTEAVAIAAALLSATVFSGPLRGFATVAAAKLVLRRGARAAATAAVLVCAPAPFGCILLSEACRAVIAITAASHRRRPLDLVRRSVRALTVLGDLDGTIADLPARTLRPQSSPTSVWSACLPKRKSLRVSRTLQVACALRRWLLFSAVATAYVPFCTGGVTAMLSRVAIIGWAVAAVLGARRNQRGIRSPKLHVLPKNI